MRPFKIHVNFWKVFTFHVKSVRDGMVIVPQARYAMTVAHCPSQLGSGGAVCPPEGPGQYSDGGLGEKAPGSLRNLAFWGIK